MVATCHIYMSQDIQTLLTVTNMLVSSQLKYGEEGENHKVIMHTLFCFPLALSIFFYFTVTVQAQRYFASHTQVNAKGTEISLCCFVC